MASPVTDLEAGLQAMLNLKPPGVSGSRITSLTQLCLTNIESESALIQKVYTHFKKAPSTHKLGVLYVVDSVTRKWMEQAKQQGQTVASSAPDGTYAAGVHRVTELMPVLMNDILQSCPPEHKEKIKKLIDIWEKGSTFPANLLQSFREKLTAPASTTPPGSPPTNPLASFPGGAPAMASAQPNQKTQSILEALSNMARQSSTAAPSAPAPVASHSVPPNGTVPPRPVSSSVSHPQWAPPAQQPPAGYPQHQQHPVNPPPIPQIPGMPPLPQFNAPPAMPQFPGMPGPAGPAEVAAPPAGNLDPNMIQTIKTLLDSGIPPDQLPAILQSLNAAKAGNQSQPPQQPPVPIPQNPYSQPPPQSWGPPGGRDEPPRDWRGGYNDRNQGYGIRSRSRSPDRGWGGRSPHNSRDDGGRRYRDSNGGDGYGGRGSYRSRSPSRRPEPTPPPGGEKWTDHDPNIPRDHIKVLSRTLFVGGVTCPEPELRDLFGRYGVVQTCIVNKDKRHAFVKMLSRKDAVSAKSGSEELRDSEMPLRTRWGVGFGPRDCSDYQTGVSTIPIQRLTEADRKWVLTAPYGGSGGRPIGTGLVIEEPDIEIGAGVSSKAISRRMQTDKGGANGPKSSRNREADNGWPSRQREADDRGRDERDGGQGPPPGFPFGIGALPNGMPNFPNGFSFPDPGAQPPRWQ